MNDILSKTFIFKGIEQSEIESILKKTKYFKQKYSKNKIIFFRDDEVQNISVILSGKVKTQMLNVNGVATLIDELSAGEILAPAFIFGNYNVYPVDIQAIEETNILHINKGEFLKLMSIDQRILNNFIRAISNKAAYLSKKIWHNVQYKTIKEKVIAYILENNKDGHFKISSLETLASEFSVERPSLSRVINNLVNNEKLKRIGRNKYEILDLDFLYQQLE